MWSVADELSGLTSHLCITLITCTALACIYWNNSRTVKLINRIPGPAALPLIGNVLEAAACQPSEWLVKCMIRWVERYGPMYRGWIGPYPVVAIACPQLMEPILCSQQQITKASEYSFLNLWLGDCMFLTTGDRWKCRRRLLTPAFHFQILNSFFDVFNERSRLLVDYLNELIQQKPDEAFDVFPVMGKCALDIICETSMGKQAVSSQESQVYFESLHRFTRLVQERAEKPWLRNDWIFHLSPLGRKSRQCVRDLHRFTNQVIRDRREALKNSRQLREECPGNNNDKTELDRPKERLAFLDLLLTAAENGAELNDDDIREEVDTVMFAGHDTTAMAMTWFVHCISKHPEEQQKLFDEMDAVFGDSDRPCTPQDATQLKYLECCIKEALRLYPSVPGILRNLTADVKIGEYTIPAGASVALMIYGMHHNPQIYPDPEAYRPERFLPENSTGRHPYAFIPFSAGPRNCIGQKYGMLEIKVVLSTLMRHFRFTCPQPADQKLQIPQAHIVLKPSQPVDVIVHQRDRH